MDSVVDLENNPVFWPWSTMCGGPAGKLDAVVAL